MSCALSIVCCAAENRRPYFDPGEYFGVQVTEGALAGMLRCQNECLLHYAIALVSLNYIMYHAC